MHFLVDIDGTIATRNLAVLLALYNRHLKLGLPDEILARITRYQDFLILPEVQEAQRRPGSRVTAQMRWLGLLPAHLRHQIPSPRRNEYPTCHHVHYEHDRRSEPEEFCVHRVPPGKRIAETSAHAYWQKCVDVPQ